MKYTDENVKNILSKIHEWYEKNHPELVRQAASAKNGGQIRAISGRFVESFLQNIFDMINTEFKLNEKIESKVGDTDCLTKKTDYNGTTYTLRHIQVDRHVSIGSKRIAFIENKTYLDSCYWDRALADFRKIVSALKQSGQKPEDVAYIVFAGQDSQDKETKLAYEGDFFNDAKAFTADGSGIKPHIFHFLEGKRKSNKPMYKIKYEIQDDVLKDFIKLILGLI